MVETAEETRDLVERGSPAKSLQKRQKRASLLTDSLENFFEKGKVVIAR
jgi:hypothetical protein